MNRDMRTTAMILMVVLGGCDAPDDLGEVQGESVLRGAGGPCTTVGDCDDGNPCTEASQCVEQHCFYTAIPGSCDDGNGCTLDDTCVAGACVGSEVVTLLSGTVTPASEGWMHYGDAAASSNGTFVTVATPTASPLYRYATYGLGLSSADLVTHDLQWSMRVGSADHDQYDASAALLPHFTGWYGWGPATRAQMIYFDEDRIGWGDESAHYLVDTTLPHTYRLHVTNAGEGVVYVDGAFALYRPSIVIGPMLGFGDQTNDWGVDGTFEIEDVELVANAWCKDPPPPK